MVKCVEVFDGLFLRFGQRDTSILMTSSLKDPAEQLEEDAGPHRERAELRSACLYGLSSCCLKGHFT